MASRAGRGGQSGEPHSHSHTRPRATAASHLPGSLDYMVWVGDTAGLAKAGGCSKLRCTEDARKPIACLLIQPAYSRACTT